MRDFNVEKHRRRYIKLTVVIFLLVGIFHGLRAIYGWTLTVGSFEIPITVSWLAFIILVLMLIMGITYIKK